MIWTRWISEIQTRYRGSLPVKIYRGIVNKLPWEDRVRFDEQLSHLDYVITGCARRLGGQDLAVSVGVVEIGEPEPFRLTKMLCKVGALPLPPSVDQQISFRLALKPDDEIWEFSSSPESWTALAGRAGFALVRQMTVIDAHVTIMN